MFGSTVEYVIRSFTNELKSEEAVIMPDGSMHSFRKQKHIVTKSDFIEFLTNKDESTFITTPIYPLSDCQLPEMLEIFEKLSDPNDKCILVHADTHESAEINMLFQYFKILLNRMYHNGQDLFYSNADKDCSKWNSEYTSYQQMQLWELREWLSLFYPKWIYEWIESQHQVTDKFLKISNSSILNDTENTLLRIIDHCGLTRNSKDLTAFVKKWRDSQEYICQEYLLIDKIIYCTIYSMDFQWNKLNMISEAILQQKLRSLDFEIQCDGLNYLPTNSIEMQKLLTPIKG
jgi:hypothetical protein